MRPNAQVITVGKEVTYKTDVVPANAIPVSNVDFKPMQGSTVERNITSPAFGASKSIHTAPYSMLSFEIEATGSGAVGTKPAYADLLEGAGRDINEVAVTNAISLPVSAGQSSLSIYFNWDGELHKLLGARGTCSLVFTEGGYPMLRFEFVGIRSNPSTVALPTPDFSGFVEPLPFNDDNTNFTLFGYAAILHSLTLDDNTSVSHRNLPNDESVNVEDRASGGQVTIDMPTIASKDYHAIIADHTTGALQIVHGVVAGNILTVDCPKVQLISPSFGDSKGFLTIQATIKALPSVEGADDEVKYTWT
jgi:hypothetical protein